MRNTLRTTMVSTGLAMIFANPFVNSVCAADLLQLYKDAQTYDAIYAASRAQRQAGSEKEVQGLAGLLPNVGLSANVTRNSVDTTQPTNSSRDYNSRGWNVQLTQPLFRWQNWVQYKQGQLQVALAEAQFQQSRQDLILRVAQAYFDVLVAQESLSSLEAQQQASGEQLELAKKSFEVGTVTVTDVHEAQSRSDLAAAQAIAARSDLEVKQQVLSQLVGKEPGVLKKLRRDADLPAPQPADIQPWVSSAEQSSYTVQSAQASLDIADREVERNRAGHLPTLDAVATYGRNKTLVPSTGLDSDATSGTLGVQLNIPLYQGGAIQSREREAAALRTKAQADLDNARRSASLAARQAYLGVSSGLAQVKALEAALTSSQSSLDANKLGYEVGVRINIDVLNAQQQLFTTRRDLAKARYDTLMSQFKLKAAAGTLNESDVEAANGLLGD